MIIRLEDAPGLLALYERHFGPYIGSFERSIEQQTHWIQHLEPEKLLVRISTCWMRPAPLHMLSC
ncbi:MAG: hypothetical protein H0W02_21635 [Ktedonobacteraceae bacterium]|nr:hypothetical protein [Ktedonobacteraceae bacterium]